MNKVTDTPIQMLLTEQASARLEALLATQHAAFNGACPQHRIEVSATGECVMCDLDEASQRDRVPAWVQRLALNAKVLR